MWDGVPERLNPEGYGRRCLQRVRGKETTKKVSCRPLTTLDERPRCQRLSECLRGDLGDVDVEIRRVSGPPFETEGHVTPSFRVWSLRCWWKTKILPVLVTTLSVRQVYVTILDPVSFLVPTRTVVPQWFPPSLCLLIFHLCTCVFHYRVSLFTISR